jgi:hypothetical protein
MDDRINIINQIEILRKNKKCYNINEYNNKLTELYNNISDIKIISLNNTNKIQNNIKLSKLYYEILNNCKNMNDILKLNDIQKLSLRFPLFDLLFIENNLNIIKKSNNNYNIQIKPILYDFYDKNQFIEELTILLKIFEFSNEHEYTNKILLIIIIFNELFLNFKFVIDNIKFMRTFKNKINEFEKEEIDKINFVINKYNLTKNCFNEWKNILEIYSKIEIMKFF